MDDYFIKIGNMLGCGLSFVPFIFNLEQPVEVKIQPAQIHADG